MPTLYAYLSGRITGAGYLLSDLVRVDWDINANRDPDDYLPMDVAAFGALAQTIDAGDVTAQARERLRFWLMRPTDDVSRIFEWSNADQDFILVPDPPSSVTLTAADLTT